MQKMTGTNFNSVTLDGKIQQPISQSSSKEPFRTIQLYNCIAKISSQKLCVRIYPNHTTFCNFKKLYVAGNKILDLRPEIRVPSSFQKTLHAYKTFKDRRTSLSQSVLPRVTKLFTQVFLNKSSLQC